MSSGTPGRSTADNGVQISLGADARAAPGKCTSSAHGLAHQVAAPGATSGCRPVAAAARRSRCGPVRAASSLRGSPRREQLRETCRRHAHDFRASCVVSSSR